MKVSCLQENLTKGLSIVGRAVSPRSTLPILSHILLETDQGMLRLSANNRETGISCWIGARVEEEGAIALPARTLIDLVNALPPDRIDMETSTRTMTLNLRCGRSEANIHGMDAVEFLPVPVPEGEGGIELGADILHKAISQVAFAAATDEAQRVLTGVMVKFDVDRLTMAAADGFRLAVRSDPLTEPITEPFSVVVPARAMVELARICADQAKAQIPPPPVTVTVTPDYNRILFKLPDVVLVSQLLPDSFPNHEQIIPRDHKTRMVVSTAGLLKACRTAQIFAREGAHIVQFHIHPQDGEQPARVVVSATSAETGSDVSELDATVEGEDVAIAFNVNYVIDVLSVIPTPQVLLYTMSSSTPGVFRPAGDEEYVYVVMPMHMGE